MKTKGILTVILAIIMSVGLIEIGSMVIVDSFLLVKAFINKDNRDSMPNYDGLYWSETYFNEANEQKRAYRSYYGWRTDQYNGETINIDSNGVRYTAGNSIEKTQTTVFLGGSTMWGIGSDDSNTIPSMFSRCYNSNALNYGELGYTAYQSYIFLQTQLISNKLQDFDLVITYDGVNNAFHNRRYMTHRKEAKINSVLKRGEYIFLENNKALIRLIIARLIKPETKYTHPLAAKELLDTWMLMKELCNSYDADFVCILQPHLFSGYADHSNIDIDRFLHLKEKYQYYNNVRELLNTEYKSLKKHFIDMSNVLDAEPNVYIDNCHLSPNGNVIIVNKLTEYLNGNR